MPHENKYHDYGNGSHFCEICDVEFPSVQLSHHHFCANHVKCLVAIAKKDVGLDDGEIFCSTYHYTMHNGIKEEHGNNKHHVRKVGHVKRFMEWCLTRPPPRGRFHWSEEFPKDEFFTKNVQNPLLNRFEEEATKLYEGEYVRTNAGLVCKSIMKLIDYLKNKMNRGVKKKVVSDYHKLEERYVDLPCISVLHHYFQSANDLLSVIKEGNKIILQDDGFWIVQDERRFSHERGTYTNLAKLLYKSDICLLKLDQHTFGFGDLLYGAHDGNVMPNQECYLQEFMMHTLALDKAVKNVMKVMIGESNGQVDIFCEALFNNIPEKYKIFYDRDMDINRFENLQPIGFGPTDSLVDADMSSVSVRGMDVRVEGNSSTYDVYDFSVGCKYQDVMKIDPRVTTGIILNDDGIGKCVRKKLHEEEFKNKVLRTIIGVNKGSIITSMFGSRTSIHVEDAFLGTYNYMLLGAPKIWYMVPKRHSVGFRKFLLDRNLLHTVISKTCFVKAFSDGEMAIPLEIILQFNIRRFVQYPGMAVMSVPGEIYHWTICCGFNLAEAGNYFTTAAGDSLLRLESSWSSFIDSGGCEGNEGSVEISSLYFNACKEFKLL